MEKVEIAPGIVVYSNVIKSTNSIHKDIEDGMKSIGATWTTASVRKGPGESTVNTEVRDTQSFGAPYHGKMLKDYKNKYSTFYSNLNDTLFESFDTIEKDYAKMFGISTTSHDSYSILKYGIGQKFINHIDDHPDFHRRVSMVYYANDDYEGGEIVFPRFDITFKPKANQMIFFPSTYVYNHSVVPVISGERYAIVSWMK